MSDERPDPDDLGIEHFVVPSDGPRIPPDEVLRHIREITVKALGDSNLLAQVQEVAARSVRVTFSPIMQDLVDVANESLVGYGSNLDVIGEALVAEFAQPITVAHQAPVAETDEVLGGRAVVGDERQNPWTMLASAESASAWAAIFATVITALTADRRDVADAATIATATVLTWVIVQVIRSRSS